MSAITTHTTGVGYPPSFESCIAFTANTSTSNFSSCATSRRIWVVSEPWSSTHEPKRRRLPNSPTAKCSKEHCQSLVPSMEIPTKTWLPCVTGGLCCYISCSLSFRFTLDPINSLPPGVCNTKSMGWGASKVFRTVRCSVLGRCAEPLVRAQFPEHPPSLNFGANHLKKWIRHPQKPPIPFLSPHNPHRRGGLFQGGGQRVRAKLEHS